jgi:hypothetical protein
LRPDQLIPTDIPLPIAAVLDCLSDASATRAQSAATLLQDPRPSLLQFATRNEIVPHIGHYADPTAAPEWAACHAQVKTRIKSYLRELDEVARTLAQHGIRLVALKNAGIARGIYPCPGCCPMGDLDVLVERRHFRRAHAQMLELGYALEFRSELEEANLQAAEEGGGAEYWKLLPSGEKLWFELQWRPVAGRWIRPDQEPSAEELMARSMPIPGTDVRLLAPEDNLLQVCLHTAKHTYVRAPGFRLHTDVDRIVNRQIIDWDLFLRRVTALQVKTACYFSLAIPQCLFHTPIPAQVLDRLRPARWKTRRMTRSIAQAGLFDPDQPKFGRLGYVAFNGLLYDNLSGLLRGVFPDAAWMRKQYGFQTDWLLPYYHCARLSNLLFRRLRT